MIGRLACANVVLIQQKGISNYVFHLVLTLTQLVYQKEIKGEQLLSTLHIALIVGESSKFP